MGNFDFDGMGRRARALMSLELPVPESFVRELERESGTGLPVLGGARVITLEGESGEVHTLGAWQVVGVEYLWVDDAPFYVVKLERYEAAL